MENDDTANNEISLYFLRNDEDGFAKTLKFVEGEKILNETQVARKFPFPKRFIVLLGPLSATGLENEIYQRIFPMNGPLARGRTNVYVSRCVILHGGRAYYPSENEIMIRERNEEGRRGKKLGGGGKKMERQ